MLLGDLIARIEEDGVAAETILRLGDIGLLTQLRRLAEANGMSLGACAAWAARTYAETAPPEEWMTLIGVMGQGEDPGEAYLRRAFAYVVAETH